MSHSVLPEGLGIHSSPSVAIAFVARAKHAQEWQSVIQAASWRKHFGHNISIHVFLLDTRDRFPPRVIESLSALGCNLKFLSDASLNSSGLSDRAIIAGEKFSEDIVAICSTGILINREFSFVDFASSDFHAAAFPIDSRLASGPSYSTQFAPDKDPTSTGAPLNSDSAQNHKFSSAMIWQKSNSPWGHLYRTRQFELLKSNAGSHCTAIDLDLPWSLASECQLGIQSIHPEFLHLSPVRDAQSTSHIITFENSSDLYQSGFNRQASAALSTSGSGFKDLMDLLQRRSDSISHANQDSGPESAHPHEMNRKIFPSTSKFMPFVIIGAMRTGSNLLQDYLNQCDGLKCYGELYNPAFIEAPQKSKFLGLTLAERDRDPRLLSDRISSKSDGQTAVGFRFFDKHLGAGLESWIKKQGARAVFLMRDPLESYISLQNAIRTKQWLLRDEGDRRMARWRFNAAGFQYYCRELSDFYTSKYRSIKNLGLPMFSIGYEELHDQSILSGLALFLGSNAPADGFKENIVKQINQDPADFIENFGEIAAAVAAAQRAWPSLHWSPSTE